MFIVFFLLFGNYMIKIIKNLLFKNYKLNCNKDTIIRY